MTKAFFPRSHFVSLPSGDFKRSFRRRCQRFATSQGGKRKEGRKPSLRSCKVDIYFFLLHLSLILKLVSVNFLALSVMAWNRPLSREQEIICQRQRRWRDPRPRPRPRPSRRPRSHLRHHYFSILAFTVPYSSRQQSSPFLIPILSILHSSHHQSSRNQHTSPQPIITPVLIPARTLIPNESSHQSSSNHHSSYHCPHTTITNHHLVITSVPSRSPPSHHSNPYSVTPSQI